MSGLKAKLSLTLAVLLLISVLIGNLITVLFAQRSMVRSDSELVNLIADDILQNQTTAGTAPNNLGVDKWCALFESRCVAAGFSSGEGLDEAVPSALVQPLTRLLEQVEGSGSRAIDVYGSVTEALVMGQRYLLLIERVESGNGGSGLFFILWDLSHIYLTIKSDQRIVLVYLLVNILFLSVIGFFRLANLVVRPIDSLIDKADQYQVTNTVFYAEGKEHSEFSQLNAALANMLKRIESDRDALQANVRALEQSNLEIEAAHREIVQAERLASVGRLSAGFAHEIGNPITIVQGYVELLKRPEINDQQKQEYGEKALEELERINRLIRQLLDYARETGKASEQVLIDEHMLEGVIDIIHIEKERAHIRVSSDFEPGLTCVGSREAIRQVLLNCLLNAIDAIVENCHSGYEGLVEIRGYKKGDDSIGKMRVEITDNGTGLTEDQINHAFDPFYSTKPIGKGTGLGLYVSHLIVESYGGRMWIHSNENRGATVFIELPLCKGEIDVG